MAKILQKIADTGGGMLGKIILWLMVCKMTVEILPREIFSKKKPMA